MLDNSSRMPIDEDTAARFMTYRPGHFHAALVYRKMYSEASPRVDIYGPLDDDLLDHLAHLTRFNTREEAPTNWHVNVHTGPDALERMLDERPGNAVVIAGRNRQKIDFMPAMIESGLHILVDKPAITEPEDFARFEEALRVAASENLVVHDMMTRRHEVPTRVQRALVNDPDVLGSPLPRSAEEPAVYLKTLHHLAKMVDGEPNRRPIWYFDIREQGEGLADVSVHLVDQMLWTMFPGSAIDYRSDVEMLSAERWPTQLTLEQFARVTGESEFPAYLDRWVEDGVLDYYCNGTLEYAVRNIRARHDVGWEYEAEEYGDQHRAIYRGEKSEVQLRQEPDTEGHAEVFVVPREASIGELRTVVRERLGALEDRWPGLDVEEQEGRLHVAIPDRHRASHEAHFNRLAERFVSLVENPGELPDWERSQLVAKYYITTRGVERSRAMD